MGAGEAFEIERSLPHGHAQAVLLAARRLGLERLLDRRPSRERSLCLAMICQRILRPASKLQTARSLSQSTLGEELSVSDADEDELYRALDWLSGRQERIESGLARRHLEDGQLVLYLSFRTFSTAISPPHPSACWAARIESVSSSRTRSCRRLSLSSQGR